MPTSIAAILGTQPRPPLADPAPQQGEAYGNIKIEWLLMGPREHAFQRKGQLAKVHAVMQCGSEGGSGNQECRVLILSWGARVFTDFSPHPCLDHLTGL